MLTWVRGTLQNVLLTVVPREPRIRAVTLVAAGHTIKGLRSRYRMWECKLTFKLCFVAEY